MENCCSKKHVNKINKKVKKVVDKTWSLEYTNKGVSDDTQ